MYLRRRFEAKAIEEWSKEMEDHLAEHEAWKIQRAAIVKGHKKEDGSPKEAIKALGPEPLRPRSPKFMLTGSMTVQGIVNRIRKDRLHEILIIHNEAGEFLSGWAMSETNGTATAATLNAAWDGGQIRRNLASEDSYEDIEEARISIHFGIQPEVVDGFINDKKFEGQGFLGRFLMAAPEKPDGGYRLSDANDADVAALKQYNAIINAALSTPRELDEQTDRPIRRELSMSLAAFDLYRAFFEDEVQQETGIYGRYGDILGLAEKAHEHAVRLAGALQFIDNPNAQEVSGPIMAGAVELMRFYLAEAIRLRPRTLPSGLEVRADRLRNWIEIWSVNNGLEIDLWAMIRQAPRTTVGKLKSRAALDVIEVLVKTGHLKVLEANKRWGITR